MNCKIPINHIPFSRYGAYLAVSKEEEERLSLHDVRRCFGEDRICWISFMRKGRRVPVQIDAEPACIRVSYKKYRAALYLRDDETLAVDSHGLDLVVRQTNSYGYGVEEPPYYHIINIHQHLYTTVYVTEGRGVLKGPVRKGNGPELIDTCQNLDLLCIAGRLTALIHVGEQERRDFPPRLSCEEEIQNIRGQWEDFASAFPWRLTGEEHFARLSWYNLWSSFVRKGGHYREDTMMMSKKSMCAVWSWDHCFNALVLVEAGMKEAALHQFFAPFDLQGENGCLPDMWRPNGEIIWTITKPPIHGWCFLKLMEKLDPGREVLSRAYEGLEKWTEWWMEYRDYDRDGIPAYPMGCDSGWDNSSVFDTGYFMESPDLGAYLVLQMKALEETAARMERQSYEADRTTWGERSKKWKCSGERMKRLLYAHNWEGEEFVSRSGASHTAVGGRSLLNLMPLALGEELEEKKRRCLVKWLKEDFLTANGPATEAPGSGKYEPDGYWRGPIWAPVTYLLADGLARGGEEELAEELSVRFRRMLEEKAGGNYENFDALTGKGLRAPGYTWTASVYLLFYMENSRRSREEPHS